MNSNKICIFAASSRQCDEQYHQEAALTGKLLAEAGYTVQYGGGGVGLMGAVANGALDAGGEVIGVIPHFMEELEWGHKDVTEMIRVDTMAERKELMYKDTAAIVALPGGCGTLEELLEVLTLKQLGLYTAPIILLNTKKYYEPLIQMLENAIKEKFMGQEHGKMWQVVRYPDEIIDAIRNAPTWSHDAISKAQL